MRLPLVVTPAYNVPRRVFAISFSGQKCLRTSFNLCLNGPLCQQAKSTNTLPAGLLQPLPIPMQIWDDVAMDFITGLPNSHGFSVILMVINRLSKYAHFDPLPSDFDSPKVAATFNTVVKLHGLPKSIVSDRDRVFTSKFWQQLCRLSGTTLAMSTAYHPQTDGQSEALNKCLEMYLRCFTGSNPKSWSRLQWEGLTAAEATWEEYGTLQDNYLFLHLEDKVIFNGEGKVTYAKGNHHKGTKTVKPIGQMAADPNDT